MKRIITAWFAVLLLTICLVVTAFANADIDNHRECVHCGMDRKAYGYSRMLVEYKDGKQVGTCSLHCVVTELNNKSGEVITVKVADRNSRKLIDATKAFWIIGGKKRGVMTARAKWAFETKDAAETFMRNYGGTLATFEQVVKATKEEQESGQARGFKMGIKR